MEARATIKFVRIGPRKVRPVMNLLRKKFVPEAFDILKNINKKGARLTEQLLKSAVANAKRKKMDDANLFIADIRADGGPILKRLMTRSMGRADRILKRTTHFQVVLIEKEGKKQQATTVEASGAHADAKDIKKKDSTKMKKVGKKKEKKAVHK
ncbi:MAG: 50S ribosomal protein L22 [Candidatus Omnitrophica bacterium]|nr:50S ribosomal protein L22 [Candidatus Omnitrophota bacterium]